MPAKAEHRKAATGQSRLCSEISAMMPTQRVPRLTEWIASKQALSLRCTWSLPPSKSFEIFLSSYVPQRSASDVAIMSRLQTTIRHSCHVSDVHETPYPDMLDSHRELKRRPRTAKGLIALSVSFFPER
eukprot:scaffold111_cov404-Prasinococcus_capsulatus_cf.AAC.15